MELRPGIFTCIYFQNFVLNNSKRSCALMSLSFNVSVQKNPYSYLPLVVLHFILKL